MTAHYSVAQVAELMEALNRITDERSRTNRSLAMRAREARGEKGWAATIILSGLASIVVSAAEQRAEK